MAPAGDGVHQPQEAEEEEKLQELRHHYSEIMQGEQKVFMGGCTEASVCLSIEWVCRKGRVRNSIVSDPLPVQIHKGVR